MSQAAAPHPDSPKATDRRVKYIRRIEQIRHVPAAQRERLRKVAEQYAFRANDYYLSLIDWADPNDPIRQLIIPRSEELSDWGRLDASNEQAITVCRGVQHKYEDTVLLLCNQTCGAYCRYCFRKRLFMNANDEVSLDVSTGLRYIAEHKEVTDVLLSGGDPLLLSTRRLRDVIGRLRAIPHVKIIRLGTKMPAFDPFRILNDAELQGVFREYSTPEKRIYLAAHFDHPRELTDVAVAGIDACIRNALICVNQCPIIRGVNDDPDVLAELYRKLSFVGCAPYYLFQGRPTAGNEPYAVPLVRAWQVFQQALTRGSGLARRPRFAMSHESGKIEILAVDDEHIYMRYHRSKAAQNRGKFFICKRDDDVFWLDDLEPAEGSFIPFGVRFRCFAERGSYVWLDDGNGRSCLGRRNRLSWPWNPRMRMFGEGGELSEVGGLARQ